MNEQRPSEEDFREARNKFTIILAESVVVLVGDAAGGGDIDLHSPSGWIVGGFGLTAAFTGITSAMLTLGLYLGDER